MTSGAVVLLNTTFTSQGGGQPDAGPGPDAGAGPDDEGDDDEDGGCGCRTVGADGPAGGAVLVLALWFALRPRRRPR